MNAISPRLHGVIDYAACAGMLTLPGLLRLSPAARTASTTFALSYLGLSTLTDYPLAVRRLIPFPVHGRVELGSTPALLLLPALLGGLKTTREKVYFLALVGTVLTVYRLTNWQEAPDA